jgi:hypothetical protein
LAKPQAKPAATSAGYSGTPLLKKLGYTSQQSAALVDAPASLRAHLAAAKFKMLTDTTIEEAASLRGPLDAVHVFARERAKLRRALPPLVKRLAPAGMIWVSWPKKAAKVETDITEDVIRAEALPLGLVDIKVCAVDEIWSGLKLVIRKELRK